MQEQCAESEDFRKTCAYKNIIRMRERRLRSKPAIVIVTPWPGPSKKLEPLEFMIGRIAKQTEVTDCIHETYQKCFKDSERDGAVRGKRLISRASRQLGAMVALALSEKKLGDDWNVVVGDRYSCDITLKKSEQFGCWKAGEISITIFEMR